MKTSTRQQEGGNSAIAKVVGFTLCAMLFALCGSVNAQQKGKVPRIGYVSASGGPGTPDRITDNMKSLVEPMIDYAIRLKVSE